MPNVIDKVMGEFHGFISDPITLQKIIDHNRLFPLLVRCGGGRFTCPAQDVEHFMKIIRDDGRDYIRDVSIPAGYVGRA